MCHNQEYKREKLVLAIDKQLDNEGCKWWACEREEGRVGWCSGGVWWWMKREREREYWLKRVFKV